jgi:hypothetical protein
MDLAARINRLVQALRLHAGSMSGRSPIIDRGWGDLARVCVQWRDENSLQEWARMSLTDHAGVRLTHGTPRVNGVEIHYAIGGAGEPVFLLHGAKTMSYWRHVVPLLTPDYTVVAVDNRGAGGSQRPMTGYDTATMADDVAELATTWASTSSGLPATTRAAGRQQGHLRDVPRPRDRRRAEPPALRRPDHVPGPGCWRAGLPWG